MPRSKHQRIGYVLKRYPRYSETFIVNEILAHEAAGLELEIFSLRPPTDTFFDEQVRQVKAPVTYLPSEGKASEFWSTLETATELFPRFRSFVAAARDEDALTGCQAMILACQARQKGIHHFHAHFATAATAVARLASNLAGLTYSCTAHAKDIFHESVDSDDLRRKLAEANAIITVSDFNRTYLQSTFGSDADRVHRVYNGLDLARFPFRSPEYRPPHIVGVGRLVEKKGFCGLIDACAVLKDLGRSFTCEIIGGGELETQLAAQIVRHGLQSHVTMRGPKPPSEIIAAIHRAAVVCAPCVLAADGNRDGLPTVLLEAMALGTPCVSTDVTGIPEVVRDGITGLLVRQHDVNSLASAMDRLMRDAPLRVRLAAKARQLIELMFDIHRNTATMRDLFQKSAIKRGKRRQLQEAG